MIEDVLVRYTHFIGIILLSSMLIVQNIVVKQEVDGQTLSLLTRVDGLYGLGASMTLIAGLLLVFWVDKPAAFYTQNWIFHLKVTLFIFVGVLSIFPTVYFRRLGGQEISTILLPNWLIKVKRIELSFLIVMPLLAVVIAKGGGH